MRVNWQLIAGCALTGAVALALGCSWMAATGTRSIPVPVGIGFAAVSVVVALAAEHGARRIRRGRPRRAHARPVPSKTRGTV